jgi:hypothetical protein
MAKKKSAQPDSTTSLAKSDDGLKTETLTILDQAKALAVTTQPEAMAAADFLKGIKALKNKIEEKLGPVVKASYDAWKKAVAYRKEHDDPLDRAEAEVKGKLNEYLAEEAKRRLKAQEEAQKEAQKEAEAKAEEDALLLEATGDAEAAEAVRSEPVVAPPVVVSPVEKPAGIATQSVWKWVVRDEGAVPREYLVLDEKKIGGVVRAMKSATNIPGIQVYEEKIIKTSKCH